MSLASVSSLGRPPPAGELEPLARCLTPVPCKRDRAEARKGVRHLVELRGEWWLARGCQTPIDEWRYPMIANADVREQLRGDARRAVEACPRLALRLVRQVPDGLSTVGTRASAHSH